MVLPGMKKKVSLQSFAMHKKVNWYMNKTIFYRSDFSSVDYNYENHFLQFQMTVDVGVKSGGEAKIHLEIQTHMH